MLDLKQLLESDEVYIFTKKAIVQWMEQDGLQGMIVATDHADAIRVKNSFAKDGNRVGVARVGSVEGETMDGQLRVAHEQGANGVFLLDSFDDNGDPVFHGYGIAPHYGDDTD